MTPKEKAEELIKSMNSTSSYNFKIIEKKCALIAVDEMLNEYPSQVPKDSHEMERHLYWQEVKQEIQKL